MRLQWSRAASLDLESIESFIGRDNPAAASATVARIIEHVAILSQHPGMGRPGRVKGTRELVVPGLPYVVSYLHERDIVSVIRVLHGAMKWPERF